MSITRRRFITISAGLALSAAVSPAVAQPFVWRGIALGAEAKLIISGLPNAEAKRLIRLARAEIHRLESIFSIYRTDSAVSRLNRTGRLHNPPPELLALLTYVETVHTATAGRFDPTVQPLWQAYAEHGGKPADDIIRKTMRGVGWAGVNYGGQAIGFEKPSMKLTLNGIAQGFISDRIAALLKSEGLENAVVNIGEICALGRGRDGKPWRVDLSGPGEHDTPDFVPLTNQAIATSAPMGTTFNDATSHIICPETGRTAPGRWDRISVVHNAAALADGLSTAFVLMDKTEILRAVKSINGASVVAKPNSGETLRSGPLVDTGFATTSFARTN